VEKNPSTKPEQVSSRVIWFSRNTLQTLKPSILHAVIQDSLQQKLFKGQESAEEWIAFLSSKAFYSKCSPFTSIYRSRLPGSPSLVHSNRMSLFLHTFPCQLPSALHWWLLANTTAGSTEAELHTHHTQADTIAKNHTF